MNISEWGNRLAVVGLVISIVGTIIQTPRLVGIDQTNVPGLRMLFFGGLGVAMVALVLLRPKSDEKKILNIRKLHDLRTKLNLRDIEFLKVALQYVMYPQAVSRDTISHAPSPEEWPLEDLHAATERAKRLILLGVLEWRGNEVQTTSLGQEVIEYDNSLRLAKINVPN